MTRWPNFFIVGAPRTATTSRYMHLQGHPDIFMPAFKEPHFFSDIDEEGECATSFVKSLAPFQSQQAYLELFAAAGTKPAVGEASAGYRYDKLAPSRIDEQVPDAKIIIILRDPVQRAYSHYLLLAQGELKGKPFYKAPVEDSRRTSKTRGPSYLLIEYGLYYEAVSRYLETFGAERVHISLYDDFVSDTAGAVEDVCVFLGGTFL